MYLPASAFKKPFAVGFVSFLSASMSKDSPSVEGNEASEERKQLAQ
jgi:hypothetical protein